LGLSGLSGDIVYNLGLSSEVNLSLTIENCLKKYLH